MTLSINYLRLGRTPWECFLADVCYEQKQSQIVFQHSMKAFHYICTR